MLYKFKSKATGDVIMLEPQGRQILQILGKDPGPKGIILAAEMPAAIDALHAAVVQEEQDIENATKDKQDRGSEPSPAAGARGIRLKQRVVPIIDMLKRAHAEEVDVVWGV